MFRALRNRNYRLFFMGQSISLIGTWMQSIALAWLVYRITNSPYILGFVGFISQLPSFLIAPFAGVVADRQDRHKTLFLIQVIAMLQAAVLAALVISGNVTVTYIIILSVILGLVMAFDMPVRHSFTVEMLDNKEDLGNAIALNSSMVNIAKLAGPSIAGLTIAVFGEEICFLINAISYSAVLTSLSMMKLNNRQKRHSGSDVLSYLHEGFRYVYRFLPVRYILSLLALVTLVGVPYQVLMPVYAKDVFHGGAKVLGFLMGMSGAGALAATFYLAHRKSIIGLGKRILFACILFGGGLIAFSLSRILWISMLLMFLTGIGMMIMLSGSNIVIQTIVDEDKRGRVMSFYTMSFLGTMPFGNLFGGMIADKIGAPSTLFISGILCVCAALWFWGKLPRLREQVTPIYVQKGILPAVPDISNV
jgi:MFS family permease